MLRIGVLLAGDLTQPGELLADARALETAGVETLWLERGAQDAWMLAAALSTVTSRARLGLAVAPGEAGGPLARRARTLNRLTRGRAVLRAEAGGLDAAVALGQTLARCQGFGPTADESAWGAGVAGRRPRARG